MAERRLTFFVSATSRDLRSYRRAAAEVLQSRGVYADVQDVFVSEYHKLLDVLRRKIVKCDGVICLVGEAFGAAPEGVGDPPRSYTQLEYDIARELGKPVYVFLTSAECPLDDPPEDTEKQRELQLMHRRMIQASGYLWHEFSSVDDLSLKVATLALPGARQAESMPLRALHPPQPPAYFAGRELELRQLSTALEGGRNCIVAVIGPGGQGKTTLVSQWWRDHREPGDILGHFAAAFWCSACDGGFPFDTFLDEVLRYLTRGQFDKRACPETDARITMLLSELQERPCLVVIDGIERWLCGWNQGAEGAGDAAEAEQRKGYFPNLDQFLSQAGGIDNGTRLVLPTRALPAALDHAAYTLVPVYEQERRKIVALQGLDPDAAVALLHQIGVRGTDAELENVADKYDRHPLALNVLGKLLVRNFGGRLTELGHVSALDPKRRLFELFEETRRKLPGRDQADRFLQVASLCLENPALPVLAAALGEPDPSDADVLGSLREMAAMLDDWHLASWDGTAQVVRLHPLTKEYFSARCPDARDVHSRLFRYYAGQPIRGRAATMEDISSRMLAIEHALYGDDQPLTAAAVDLFFAPVNGRYTLSEWLSAFGHLEAGIRVAGRLAAALPEAPRGDLLTVQAAMLRQLGKLSEATRRAEEAVAVLDGIGRRATDAKRAALAGALMNLGNVYHQARRFREAAEGFNRAIRILRTLRSRDWTVRAQLAAALMNRASCLANRGYLERALADYDRSTQTFERLVDEGHEELLPNLLTAIIGRADTHADHLDFTRAVREIDRAISRLLSLLESGREELWTQLIDARISRGALLIAWERPDEALKEFDQVLPLLEKLIASGRKELEPLRGLVLMDCALAHVTAGQHGAARPEADQAVGVFQRLVDKGQFDVAGWLAHSLLIRAEAAYPEAPAESAADRQRGVELAREGIEQLDQLRMSIILCRRLVSIAVLILPDNPKEAVHVLDEALAEAERVLRFKDPPTKMRLEARKALQRLQTVAEDLAAAGWHTSRIRQLGRLTATPATGKIGFWWWWLLRPGRDS